MLLRKTPPGCMGLVGPQPDDRTLPISERLDRYRDTEASLFSIFTSGNGVELIHTKFLGNVVWAMLWAAVSESIFEIAMFRTGVWGAPEILEFLHFMIVAGGMVLPLCCRTARMFVVAYLIWFPAYYISMLLFLGAIGSFLAVVIRMPLFLFGCFLLKYRQRYFLRGACTTFFLGYLVDILADCAQDYTFHQWAPSNTYDECVVFGMQLHQRYFYAMGGLLFYLTVTKIVNDVSTYRAARESREQHRHPFLFPAPTTLNPKPP